MSDEAFETRIRQMALLSPRLSVRTAVLMADASVSGVTPFPEDREDVDALTVWAVQFPEIMEPLVEGNMIKSIAAMREIAPRDKYNRPLGLLQAKRTAENLRVL